MKKLLLLLSVIAFSQAAFSQTARVQVIHNSPDALTSEVDVYVDDALTLDDFTFRTASPFVDLPAEVEIELSVAPATSSSVNDAVLTVPVTLTDGETYIVVADGILSPTGYNPAPPVSLQVFPMGREAATQGTNTDVLVHHGSTDAGPVDVVETGAGAGTIVDDIAYTEFQGYLELPTADYVLEVRDVSGTTGIAAYEAPLSSLSLDGAAIVVLASGFLDPSENSNGPAFGLWVALPAGGDLVELPGAALGINDLETSSIQLYPNPVDQEFRLSGLESDTFTLRISDVQGRTVTTENYSISNNVINTSRLATGMYVVTITEGSSTTSIRFLKR